MSCKKVKKAEIFENTFLNIAYEDGTLCQIDLEKLFDVEFIKEIKMSKCLEELKKTKSPFDGVYLLSSKLRKEIKKELEALEIIKEKRVEVMWLINRPLEDYNKNHFFELTQEEYDLLKKVLL